MRLHRLRPPRARDVQAPRSHAPLADRAPGSSTGCSGSGSLAGVGRGRCPPSGPGRGRRRTRPTAGRVGPLSRTIVRGTGARRSPRRRSGRVGIGGGVGLVRLGRDRGIVRTGGPAAPHPHASHERDRDGGARRCVRRVRHREDCGRVPGSRVRPLLGRSVGDVRALGTFPVAARCVQIVAGPPGPRPPEGRAGRTEGWRTRGEVPAARRFSRSGGEGVSGGDPRRRPHSGDDEHRPDPHDRGTDVPTVYRSSRADDASSDRRMMFPHGCHEPVRRIRPKRVPGRSKEGD